MAATDEQKLKTRLLLGITAAEAAMSVADGDDADGLNVYLDALSALELDELDVILAQAEKVKTRAAVVDNDGVKLDPEEQRRLLRERCSALVGVGIIFTGFVGTVMTQADYEATFE